VNTVGPDRASVRALRLPESRATSSVKCGIDGADDACQLLVHFAGKPASRPDDPGVAGQSETGSSTNTGMTRSVRSCYSV
jgi:hypothetical protein